MLRDFPVLAVLFSIGTSFGSVNVLDFGAKADGHTNSPTDNSAAFERARAAALNGDGVVLIPAGTYQTRSFSAAGVIFRSAAPGSPRPRIKAYSVAGSPLVTLGTGSQLENIELDGGESPWYEGEAIHAPSSKNIILRDLRIHRFRGAAVFGDNLANNMPLTSSDFGIKIQNCSIENIHYRTGREGLGIYLANSQRLLIESNSITNVRDRGIFLWAEWKSSSTEYHKLGKDVEIRNNSVVYDPSRAPMTAIMQDVGIEVHGTVDAKITGNIVSGARDVGLDVEWCDRILISGNSVSNSKNGGISVFFSSHGIRIENNTVDNNYQGVKTDGHPAILGIWVTTQNRNPADATNPGRPYDYSNQDITIRQNTINLDAQAQSPRLSIFVQGYSNKNILIAENKDNRPEEKTVAIGGHDLELNKRIAEVNGRIDCSSGNCIQVPPPVDVFFESPPLQYLY